MKRLLISLADFPDFVPFSVNIGAHLVDPHIRDAQTFDVALPAAVYAALDTALGVVLPEFKPSDFDGAEFATTAAVAGWTDLPLAALWYAAVRPLLVLHAARRMLLWHGLHITPNGAEITVNQPISGQQRTELRADLQAKANQYEAVLAGALRTYLPVTPTVCGATRRRRNSGGFSSHAL
jgi:hypothetical protein